MIPSLRIARPVTADLGAAGIRDWWLVRAIAIFTRQDSVADVAQGQWEGKGDSESDAQDF